MRGGGKSRVCLLISDFSLYLRAQLEGSLLSCELPLVRAQATSLIQTDLKRASEDEAFVLHKGWERMERRSV